MIARFGASWSEAIYWTVAFAMLAACAGTLLMMVVDARTIDGHTSVWTKPFKFELSLTLHAATLALALSLLSPPYRQGPAMLLVAIAFLAACAVEMGYIIAQGARGEHSHFNVATPFHRFMYSVMAFAAVVIVGTAGAVGLAILADADFSASSAVKAAIVLGFVGGTVLTLVTGLTIGGRMSPYVGGMPDFDARMLFTGWSKSGGDLRVSHFFATHMIQVVPIVGLVLERFASGRIAMTGVISFAVMWTLLTVLEFRTGLAGKPSAVSTTLP
jgi:hypothetical protein